MAYNGSGVFDPPALPDYPAVAGDVIYAARFNTVMQEVFDGLSNCLAKDGQSVVAADINWGNFKLSNASKVIIGTLTDNGNALQVTGNSTLDGNLTLSGNARRITANFSDANRALFQTSTTNASSGVGVIANGSGAGGYFNTYSGSDPANASIGQFFTLVNGVNLNSSSSGTGTPQPINLSIAGVTKLNIADSQMTYSDGTIIWSDTNSLVATMTSYISYRDSSAAEVAWMGFGAGNGEMGFNNSSRNIRFISPVVFDTTVTIGNVSSTEIGYLDGVTSAIQTQLNAKEASFSSGTTAQYLRGDKTWQTLNSTAVGLGNVDNTSDATKNAASVTLTNKTISGASNTFSNIPQAAVTSLTTDLGLKAPLASPAFTGTPTVPTAAPGTNTTQAASTAFVTAAVGGAVSSGTFTPVVTGASSAGVGTYGYQEGYWSRIGDCVTFSLYVYWTSHTGTGQARVSLPFTSASSAPPVSCSINLFGGALLTSDMIPKTLITSNSAYVGLAKIVPSTGSDAALNMAYNGAFVISGSYYV